LIPSVTARASRAPRGGPVPDQDGLGPMASPSAWTSSASASSMTSRSLRPAVPPPRDRLPRRARDVPDLVRLDEARDSPGTVDEPADATIEPLSVCSNSVQQAIVIEHPVIGACADKDDGSRRYPNGRPMNQANPRSGREFARSWGTR
jgi:hypothetical protein